MLFVWFLTRDSSVGHVLHTYVLEVSQSEPPRLAPYLGQVRGTMLLPLGDRYHPPANVQGSDDVNPESRGNIGASDSLNRFGRL